MKNLLTTIAVFLFISTTAFTQSAKFGHIDFEKLIEQMPEKDSALKVLQKEYEEAKNLIEEMTVEFNQKYMSAQESYETLSDFSKQMLEDELMQLQERIQQYQTAAEQRLAERREQLLKPILDKAENAIKTVSEREGFIYIFDVSEGSQILYYSAKSIDVMPLVKKELGLP